MSVPARAARERRLGTVAVALVLIASACSADGDSTEATTAPTTVPADTTAVPATTATPADTTASPTTTTTPRSTTTVPETTAASPTTTLAPDASTTTTVAEPEVQAVIDAAHASWMAYIGAIREPGDEARLLELAETKRGEALTSSVRIIEDLIVKNQRAIPHPDIDADFVPRPESVEVDGESAVIEYCWIGSDIIVEVGANDEGADRIVNDEVLIFVERERFEVIDGRWRKVSGVVLEQIEGEVSCNGIV